MTRPAGGPRRAEPRGTMDENIKSGADHTVDPTVLPTPAPVEYETGQPAGPVETFDTGLILVVP